jgi:hypothetical protein
MTRITAPRIAGRADAKELFVDAGVLPFLEPVTGVMETSRKAYKNIKKLVNYLSIEINSRFARTGVSTPLSLVPVRRGNGPQGLVM